MKTMPIRCRLRFHGELNFFVAAEKREREIERTLPDSPAVKDLLESLGPPHTEIELLLVNGRPRTFEYRVKQGDRIAAYPLDFSETSAGRPVFEKLPPLRPPIPEEPRFVIDVNLGKLARYLRLLGFDCYYRNDLDDPQIVQVAAREKRIVLTRDLGILKTAAVVWGYYPRSQDSREQLREVMRRYNLKDRMKPFSRCAHCNGELGPVSKARIIDELQEETRRSFDEFYRCAGCGRIYWKGSHYERMTAFIAELPE